MQSLASTPIVWSAAPYIAHQVVNSDLKRKAEPAPSDDNTFIKPLKQVFIRNQRLMPGTRLMISLLAGWSGNGDPIKTTMSSIAKHLGRSSRQVFRYLKDAVEEGYLRYTPLKDRHYRYVGICVELNLQAIRFKTWDKRKKKSGIIDWNYLHPDEHAMKSWAASRPAPAQTTLDLRPVKPFDFAELRDRVRKPAETLAMTHQSEINGKHINKEDTHSAFRKMIEADLDKRGITSRSVPVERHLDRRE